MMETILRVTLILALTVLTALIFYNSRWNRERIKLGLLSFSITWWTISFEMLKMAATTIEVMIWAKSIFIAAPSAIVSMYALSREFRKKEVVTSRYHSRIVYFLYVLIVSIIAFTDMVITVGNPGADTIVEKAPIGIFFVYCMLFYIYVIICYFTNLVVAYRRNAEQRIKINYIALSTIITSVIAILTTGVFPLLHINNYVWYGPYSTAIFIGVLTYSILKYRLLDIDLLVRRMVVLIVVSGAMLLINVVSFYLMGVKPDTIAHVQLVYIVTINLFLMVMVYLNHNNLERIGKRIFLKKQEDYLNSLVTSIKELGQHIRKEELIAAVEKLLCEKMEIAGTVFYLRENANDRYYVKKTFGVNDCAFPERMEQDHALAEYLESRNMVVDKGELKHNLRFGRISEEERDYLKGIIMFLDTDFCGSMVIPLIAKKRLLGAVFLQNKKSGYPYTNAEILLLRTLGLNVATLLDNIMLHEKTIKSEKMALIGTMASSFAHEIRNPLTSVNTYMGMLPEKLENRSFLEKFLAIVPREIERVVKLTTDMMNFAKSNQAVPMTTDVRTLISRVLELVKNESEKKQMEISVECSHDITVMADENQLYQVLLNMLLNAIHASDEKKRISIAVHDSDSHTEMMISDEGEGIAEENLGNIFEPFYSTKIYGTGLGLATCKRIVESHGGTILVESKKGQGSVFTIVLPKNFYKPQNDPKAFISSGMIG